MVVAVVVAVLRVLPKHTLRVTIALAHVKSREPDAAAVAALAGGVRGAERELAHARSFPFGERLHAPHTLRLPALSLPTRGSVKMLSSASSPGLTIWRGARVVAAFAGAVTNLAVVEEHALLLPVRTPYPAVLLRVNALRDDAGFVLGGWLLGRLLGRGRGRDARRGTALVAGAGGEGEGDAIAGVRHGLESRRQVREGEPAR